MSFHTNDFDNTIPQLEGNSDNMDILAKYNKSNVPMFTYDNEQQREFINLKGLYEANGSNTTYRVDALFINTKSKFGNAPLVIIDGFMVNLPKHLLETVEEMKEDGSIVMMANNDRLGFNIYEYTGTHGKAYSINWVTL